MPAGRVIKTAESEVPEMTKEEAQALLNAVPASSEPSRVNRALTRDQMKKILLYWLNKLPAGNVLTYSQEKRIQQVCQNRLRPKFRD